MTDSLAQDVLSYWHSVEFFNHYDLDDQIADARSAKRVEFYLPFGQAEHAQWTRQEGTVRDIYFLPFDVGQVTALAVAQVGAALSEMHRRRDEEFTPEGGTCFARLRILADGTPDFPSLSVSSLPWAAGMLARRRLRDMCAVTFEAGVADLIEELKSAWSCRAAPTVTPELLGQFAALLVGWAGFQPPGDNIAWVDVAETKKSTAPANENTQEAPPAQEMPILNSFFYHDLKYAATALRDCQASHPLHVYLSGQWPAKLDLDSADGQREILAALDPALTNAGRWPSEPAKLQSLMQQFALNKMRALQPGEILSVNGPPGTGKTTLVKDLIADLVVQRALVLAGLATAKDGLSQESAVIGFHGETQTFPRLIPALTGFEILVASSNNGAVENLSLELPQRSGTARNRHQSLRYFDKVANKYAGTRNGKAWAAPLEPVWGLMSAALGKAANRRRFQQIFAYNAKMPAQAPEDKFLKESMIDLAAWQAENALSYWSFAKHARASVPTFHSARKAFLQAMEQHAANESLLQALRNNWLSFLAAWELNRAQLDLHTDLGRDDAVPRAAAELEAKAAQLQRRSELLASQLWPVPVRWLMRWLSAARYQAWRASQQHAMLAAAMRDDILAIAQLYEQSGGVHLWDGKALHSARSQGQAFWQGAACNESRNALFAAAMELHQAFFLEAAPASAVISISKMLGQRVTQGNALFVWQWLFMLVPVVSSTFASIRNQLRGIDPGSLGWLIIDEAGQAVPQAAVGALLRVRRAVVVGDPLQIAPVVPLPTRLLLELGKVWLGDNAGAFAVHEQSVQTLADRAHRYGVRHPHNGDAFIGIPLVMHRRCDNPMFTIANKIAYKERMLHAKSGGPGVHEVLGKSAWWHVRAPASQGKYVEAQGELLFDGLVALYLAQVAAGGDGLPKVYVITPFREVKKGLVALLLDRAQWQSRLEVHGAQVPANLADLRANIGTVHTFQGKEEDIVFFVLGCDHSHGGAVGWAASSPNLLNVAVTRARRYCYIIGDKTLWGSTNGFDVALVEMGGTT